MIRKAIVTKRGLEKIQNLPFGSILELTKITGGGGNSSGELVDTITQLHAPFFVEDITIKKEGVLSGGTHIISELAQNLAGNTLTELGLLDSTGELIVYCVCEPVSITNETDLEIIMVVPFNANQVKIVINSSDAYVKRSEFDSLMDNVMALLAPADLSSSAEQLANTNNEIYSTLPTYVTAVIPAGVMKMINDSDGNPLFIPRDNIEYVLSITTLKNTISFDQQLTIIERTDDKVNVNLAYRRSGRNFSDASSVGWSFIIALQPNQNLLVNNIQFMGDIVRLNGNRL